METASSKTGTTLTSHNKTRLSVLTAGCVYTEQVVTINLTQNLGSSCGQGVEHKQ